VNFNKIYIRHFILLAVSLALFFFGIYSNKLSFYSLRQYTLHKRFQEDLYSKEFQLDDLLDDLEDKFRHFNSKEFFTDFTEQELNTLSKEGIILFVYENDTLTFWSDNSLPIDLVYDEDLFREPSFFLSNGWFLRKTEVFEEVRVVGLILIKTEYSYENKFLKNEFNDDFLLPSATKIFYDPDARFPVYTSLGDYLFSLDFSEIERYSVFHLYFSLFCFLSGILLFLLSLRFILRSIEDHDRKNIGLLLLAAIIILLDAILIKMKVPSHLSSVTLFSPAKFAASDWFPSLGHLLITSFMVFFFAYNYYREFHIPDKFFQKRKTTRVVLMLFYVLLMAIFYQAILSMFYSLVINSSITFETYKVLNISIYTFLGFLIIAFFFATLALLADKFILIFNPEPSICNLFVYPLLFGILTGCVNLFTSVPFDVIPVLFAVLILIIMALTRYRYHFKYSYSTFVLLVFFFSMLTVYQVFRYSLEKQKEMMKVMAVDLSTEHDPVAELLLEEMEDSIANDRVLETMIFDQYTDVQFIYDYLVRKYFSGFWDKYDLQCTICSPQDSVYVEPPEDQVYHCYEFFEDHMATYGIRIPDSRFYFMDNLNGRISYFAPFEYYSPDSLFVFTLFLELNSKAISRGLGYPELLLASRSMDLLSDEYSYAKYNKNELITQSGPYSYSLRSDLYTEGKEEYEFIRMDGYRHCIYNVDEDNTIILSSLQLKTLDVLITFTYIFIFFYLLITIILLVVNIPFFQRSFQMNIKNRIQYSMIAILVFSLLLIGGGTIFFSVRQYKERQFESLSEKIQSVHIELVHKLAFETTLKWAWQSDTYQSLDELLVKFSNVFFTDINLYDPDGVLLATSRPEIFERGLLGIKIHPSAYRELIVNNRNEFVHEERIGTLKYLSAYVPFKNNENKLLAYLNLPYFTKQDVLTREISNLVAGIINFYVILITISIVLAVFLSNKMTQPLRMIQDKIRTFTLGKTNEKISYEAEDEIGSLVREYNHMVDELARSAELLARSERESAWREMAKQIAHEIKNPLTPMKLSVQHLQRAWQDNPDKWEKNLKRIAGTLIEQIDELSAIANEFSNFAKMPKAENVKLDLREKINDVLRLFINTEKIEFKTVFTSREKTFIFADKEQISRVFINLIKNAVQSIPEDRKGLIIIEQGKENGFAIIKVKDNGRGIPGDIGNKLFQPNFTTKSGGMGMGLAIVKSIVENVNGEIGYETTPGEGTTFTVKLPLYEKKRME
jgi:two-component system nitrogen regulation sensor histidine kinase NtrY